MVELCAREFTIDMSVCSKGRGFFLEANYWVPRQKAHTESLFIALVVQQVGPSCGIYAKPNCAWVKSPVSCNTNYWHQECRGGGEVVFDLFHMRVLDRFT